VGVRGRKGGWGGEWWGAGGRGEGGGRRGGGMVWCGKWEEYGGIGRVAEVGVGAKGSRWMRWGVQNCTLLEHASTHEEATTYGDQCRHMDAIGRIWLPIYES